MSYKDITTLEQAEKIYPGSVSIEKMKEAIASFPQEISRGMIALASLQVVIYAINNDEPKEEVFKPDYNNGDQEKWAPWWRGGDESGSGFRFDGTNYGWTAADTAGGARLALKDEDRALHMKTHFPELYKELLLILK